MWKNEDGKRPAVVTSVNAVERTAKIRFTDTQTTELVSVLELDPHGYTDWAASTASDALGVHRGEFVFIHPEGTTNGSEDPMVPRIGELEDWVREIPSMTCNGQITGWRREMSTLGSRIANARGKPSAIPEGSLIVPERGDERYNWFGEVLDVSSYFPLYRRLPDILGFKLRLDGTVEVVLPDSSTVVVPLNRITRLYDGIEQMEDTWGEDELEGSITASIERDQENWSTMDNEGHWITDTSNPAEWTDEDDIMEADINIRWTSSSPTAMPTSESDKSLMAILADDGHRDLSEPPEQSIPPTLRTTTPDDPKDSTGDGQDDHEENETDENPQWKRFEVLSSAPVDHAFYGSPPAQPSRAFLARLTKEYRVLSTTLPGTTHSQAVLSVL